MIICEFIRKSGIFFFFQLFFFIRVAIFSRCSFGIKLSWFQRKFSKMNSILYDLYRFYLQNCKTIAFAKITNDTKKIQPNVRSHLHVFWLNFDEVNHSFLHSFLLFGEPDFPKKSAWRNEYFSFGWAVMTRT